MPITKSAKKALRQNIKRRTLNRGKKRRIKELYKKMELLLSQGKKQEAKNLLPQYQKMLDKAAKRNTIHANKAARNKSKMAKKVK